jgi:hypothetical protein
MVPTASPTPYLIRRSLDFDQTFIGDIQLPYTMNTRRVPYGPALAGSILSAALLLSPRAFAHCDTMDGPVIIAAKAALDKRDITPVLKWVKPDGEAEVKAAFAKTLAVRAKGPEVRDLADQFFFETLVRVHRAGEGAPFTGLKPAGTPLEQPVRAADDALESNSVDKVVKLVTEDAAAGIRKRFAEVQEKKRHAEHNVEAGREFVAAYVEYVHYVEGLHLAAQAAGAHHAEVHEVAPDQGAHHEPGPQHKH